MAQHEQRQGEQRSPRRRAADVITTILAVLAGVALLSLGWEPLGPRLTPVAAAGLFLMLFVVLFVLDLAAPPPRSSWGLNLGFILVFLGLLADGLHGAFPDWVPAWPGGIHYIGVGVVLGDYLRRRSEARWGTRPWPDVRPPGQEAGPDRRRSRLAVAGAAASFVLFVGIWVLDQLWVPFGPAATIVWFGMPLLLALAWLGIDLVAPPPRASWGIWLGVLLAVTGSALFMLGLVTPRWELRSMSFIGLLGAGMPIGDYLGHRFNARWGRRRPSAETPTAEAA